MFRQGEGRYRHRDDAGSIEYVDIQDKIIYQHNHAAVVMEIFPYTVERGAEEVHGAYRSHTVMEEEIEFYSYDQRNGISIMWCDGKLDVIRNYSHGKHHGEGVRYDSDGLYRYFYRDDQSVTEEVREFFGTTTWDRLHTLTPKQMKQVSERLSNDEQRLPMISDYMFVIEDIFNE